MEFARIIPYRLGHMLQAVLSRGLCWGRSRATVCLLKSAAVCPETHENNDGENITRQIFTIIQPVKHSALAQTNLRKKPAVARAGDRVLGNERTIDAKKGRDTHEELWPWVINTGAGTPLRDCSREQPMQGQ